MDDLPHFVPDDDLDEAPPARRARRDSMLLSATLQTANGLHQATVRVRNISATGLMFEAHEAFGPGAPVAVTLRGVGRVTGTIVWCEQDRTGMAFDEPIDPLLTRKPVKVPAARSCATIGRRPPPGRMA